MNKIAEFPRDITVGDERPSLRMRLEACARPGLLLFNCVYETLRTFVQAPLAVRNLQEFRHHAFSNFWLKWGALLSQNLPGTTTELVSSASGVVLDIGPGDGSLVHLFDGSKFEKAYAPEPALDLHPTLLKKVKAAGLAGKYQPLACGAEPKTLLPALAKAGLLKSDGKADEAVFDTIVSMRVLCGVPDPEATVQQLYRLLKPGGRLIVAEHVKNDWPHGGDILGWIVQRFYVVVGWNFWMGGCKLNRDTRGNLLAAGGKNGWAQVELTDIDSWAPIPYVVGTLVKA